jgi:hypothetical protein
MKLQSLFEEVTIGWNSRPEPGELYAQNEYWSPVEKEFYGPLPKLPYKDTFSGKSPDKRSLIHCASNCPHGLKPLIAIEDSPSINVFIIKGEQLIPLNELIKNRKDNYVVWEHARNVITDINNEGAAGFRHNVRQKTTYIINDEHKAYKAILYSVNRNVAKVLSKYGFNF